MGKGRSKNRPGGKGVSATNDRRFPGPILCSCGGLVRVLGMSFSIARDPKRKKVPNKLKGVGALSKRRRTHSQLDKELNVALKAKGCTFRGFNPSEKKRGKR